jgi:hypothetical protein
MSYTPADLAAIDTAILALATGRRVATVTLDGATTSYAPADLSALQRLRAEVAGATSTGMAHRTRYARQSGKQL